MKSLANAFRLMLESDHKRSGLRNIKRSGLRSIKYCAPSIPKGYRTVAGG